MKIALLFFASLALFGLAAFDGSVKASICCIGRCSAAQAWSKPAKEPSLAMCKSEWKDYCGRVTYSAQQVDMSLCPY